MSLLFQILASGSKGNAVLVASPRTRILLDAGLSVKELVKRLERTPVVPRDLDGLVLSHEHTDHTRGTGPLSRRFNLPVFCSQGTLERLPPQTGQLAQCHIFQTGRAFSIGDLHIHPFSISHDAQEPCGFVIQHEQIRLGVCTDLGVVTHLVRERLRACDALIVEANHDTKMLLDGPYPPHLKQRIRSSHGHISNEESKELVRSLYHQKLRYVFLAHLSDVNNHPRVVLESFKDLAEDPQWRHMQFGIAKQHEPSATIELP